MSEAPLPSERSSAERVAAADALSAAFEKSNTGDALTQDESPWRLLVLAEQRIGPHSEWKPLTRMTLEQSADGVNEQSVQGDWRHNLYFGGDDFAVAIDAPAVCVKLFSRNALVSGNVPALDFWRQLQFWSSDLSSAGPQEQRIVPSMRCVTASDSHPCGHERGIPLDATYETIHFYATQHAEKYYASTQASHCTLEELQEAGFEHRWRNEFREFAKVTKEMRRCSLVPRMSDKLSDVDRSAIRLIYWLYWPKDLRHMDVCPETPLAIDCQRYSPENVNLFEQNAQEDEESESAETMRAKQQAVIKAFEDYFCEENSEDDCDDSSEMPGLISDSGESSESSETSESSEISETSESSETSEISEGSETRKETKIDSADEDETKSSYENSEVSATESYEESSSEQTPLLAAFRNFTSATKFVQFVEGDADSDSDNDSDSEEYSDEESDAQSNEESQCYSYDYSETNSGDALSESIDQVEKSDSKSETASGSTSDSESSDSEESESSEYCILNTFRNDVQNHIVVDLSAYMDVPTIDCYVQSEEHRALYFDPLTGDQEIQFDAFQQRSASADTALTWLTKQENGQAGTADARIADVNTQNEFTHTEETESEAAAREYDALLSEATELALAASQKDCDCDTSSDESIEIVERSTLAKALSLCGMFLVVGTQKCERDAFYRWLTAQGQDEFSLLQQNVTGDALSLETCLHMVRDAVSSTTGRTLLRVEDFRFCDSTLVRFMYFNTNTTVEIDVEYDLKRKTEHLHDKDVGFIVLTASATISDFEDALSTMCDNFGYNDAQKERVLSRWDYNNAESPLAAMNYGDALVVPLLRLHMPGFDEPKLVRGIF